MFAFIQEQAMGCVDAADAVESQPPAISNSRAVRILPFTFLAIGHSLRPLPDAAAQFPGNGWTPKAGKPAPLPCVVPAG
ncbi:MAG: hypothetical protein P4L83_23930 [Nevskia sp.]|nr:hypothetical protein [Nevskia sp.]